MTTLTVTRDALGLSSGTIASLIGNTRYDTIDAVQSEFVLYCKDHEGEFETWKDAWKAYFNERILITVKARGGEKVRVSRLDLDSGRHSLPIYNRRGVKIIDQQTYDPKKDSGRTHIIRANIEGTQEFDESTQAVEALYAKWEAEEANPSPAPDFPTVAGEGAPQYTFLPKEEEQFTLNL